MYVSDYHNATFEESVIPSTGLQMVATTIKVSTGVAQYYLPI